MSRWNYRIMHFAYPGYMIREVFYDDAGNPIKHGEAGPHMTLFDEPGEIRAELELMLQAFGRPVLKDFVKPKDGTT